MPNTTMLPIDERICRVIGPFAARWRWLKAPVVIVMRLAWAATHTHVSQSVLSTDQHRRRQRFWNNLRAHTGFRLKGRSPHNMRHWRVNKHNLGVFFVFFCTKERPVYHDVSMCLESLLEEVISWSAVITFQHHEPDGIGVLWGRNTPVPHQQPTLGYFSVRTTCSHTQTHPQLLLV